MDDRNPFAQPLAPLEDKDNGGSPKELRYAGFWRRFGAYWVDLLVFLPLTGLVLWVGGMTRLFQLYYFVPGLLIGMFFHVYLVKRYGGTPGKLLMKTRISRLDGTAVSYRDALIRYSVLFVLSALISIATLVGTLNISDSEYLSLGFQARNLRLMQLVPGWFMPVNILLNIWIWGEFVVMLTNKRRRALHDFMAGTVVIRVA